MPSFGLRVSYALLACVLWLAWMQRIESASRIQSPAIQGQRAPLLHLERMNGTSFSLDRLRGRWVLLNFWATWCEPCRREMPDLERLAQIMAAEQWNAVLIAASVDQNWPLVQGFLKKERLAGEKPLAMQIVRDPDGIGAQRYGTNKFPETYLIDPNGILRAKWIGVLAWDSPAIRAMLRKKMQSP
jgi:thiol-disulfide isomerase/thioredoxin